MKEKLRITSRLKETEWVGKRHNGQNWEVLTTDYHIVNLTTFENDAAFKGAKILKIGFTPYNQVWELEYDTKDKSTPPKAERTDEDLHLYNQIRQQNELNRRKRIAVKEFFSKHDQLAHASDFENNFTPSGFIIGEVEIVTQKGRLNHLADRKKVKVFSKIDAMDWQEQYDLILYYAPELAGKRRSEALNGLIGLKGIGTSESFLGGKMWQKYGNKGMTVADDFLTNYGQSNTIVMKIYVNKAINLGVIVKGENGLLLNGTTFLGRDADDAVIYFTKDIQTYTNVIQPEVNRLENLPEDDLQDEPADVYTGDKHQRKIDSQAGTAQYKDDYKKLLKELNDLGGSVPYKNNLTYKELQKRVEEQREKVKQIAENKSLPTTELNNAVDPTSSDDIDDLKKVAQELGIVGWAKYKDAEKLREVIRNHAKRVSA